MSILKDTKQQLKPHGQTSYDPKSDRLKSLKNKNKKHLSNFNKKKTSAFVRGERNIAKDLNHTLSEDASKFEKLFLNERME